MSLERLGIFEANQARRLQYARPHPYVMPQRTIIVVNCATGRRRIHAIVPQPPVMLKDLVKPTPDGIIHKPQRIPELPPTEYRREHPNPAVSIFSILASVSDAYGTTVAKLLGPWRYRTVAWPRFAAMKLMRDMRWMSTSQIGFCLGKRDHTTVLHGLWRADQFYNDPAMLDWRRRYDLALASIQT